jgi:hypothetical protein
MARPASQLVGSNDRAREAPISRPPSTVSDRDHTNGIPIAAEYEREWEAPQWSEIALAMTHQDSARDVSV